MSTMERILRLMSEKKASDVYLSAYAPAMIKINGQCLPINNQLLPADAPISLLAEVLPPGRITELEESGELNMAHAIEGVGNFRISAMRQRGTEAQANAFTPLCQCLTHVGRGTFSHGHAHRDLLFRIPVSSCSRQPLP